jgi:hypothetical protein
LAASFDFEVFIGALSFSQNRTFNFACFFFCIFIRKVTLEETCIKLKVFDHLQYNINVFAKPRIIPKCPWEKQKIA